ncbi:hypothetical protein V6N11_043791 [Hibiscus sabdariffa]|uniref:Uncharacterized protein n=1 Tax=Hibiscus sabdariffa TaxID=183260 RepID=A0ABR2RDL5_9ROSI
MSETLKSKDVRPNGTNIKILRQNRRTSNEEKEEFVITDTDNFLMPLPFACPQQVQDSFKLPIRWSFQPFMNGIQDM